MKKLIAACLLLVACTDKQNLGDTMTPPAPVGHSVFLDTRWALTLGGIDKDGVHSAALDSTGDVIVAGYFNGTVDFGTQTLTSAQTYGAFLTKRAGADGAERWTLTLGTDTATRADIMSVQVGSDDSVFIGGPYAGDLQIGSQTLHGPSPSVSNDCMVAKYDATGTFQWASTLGAASVCDNERIAIGTDGRVAMIGTYNGTLTFPSGTYTATDADAFVAVFDPNGNLEWGAVSTPGLALYSVAMSAEDDVVISGDVHDHTTYQGTLFVANSYETQFAARWTVDGHLLWAGLLGDAGISEQGGQIAFQSNGMSVFGATKRSDSDNDNGIPLLTTLDPSGHSMWQAQAVSGSASVDALTAFPNGMTAISSYSAGSLIDFGNGASNNCLALAAYSPAGEFLDAESFVPTGNYCGGDTALGLASASGSLVMAGAVDNGADFGTGPLRFAGGTDAMIVMFDTAQ